MLMGLSEQLNLPRIRMMVDAVELGSSDQNLLSSFRTQHQDIKWVGLRTAVLGQDFMVRCCQVQLTSLGRAGC